MHVVSRAAHGGVPRLPSSVLAPNHKMHASGPRSSAGRQDLSVILVTGSYDREIRFWEAWSGICSRTIARASESGVSSRPARFGCTGSRRFDSKSTDWPSPPSQSTFLAFSFSHSRGHSKRLLAAACHKKIHIYEIASSATDPVRVFYPLAHVLEVTSCPSRLSHWNTAKET